MTCDNSEHLWWPYSTFHFLSCVKCACRGVKDCRGVIVKDGVWYCWQIVRKTVTRRAAYNTQSERHGICLPRWRCWKMGASNSWRNVSNGLFSWDKCPPLGIEQSGGGGKGGRRGWKNGTAVTKILRPMLTELTNWGIRWLQSRPKKPCPNFRSPHLHGDKRTPFNLHSTWH